MRITHSWTDRTATIAVEGLQKMVRVLHVTDSHLGLIDERDEAFLEDNCDYRDRIAQRRRDLAGQPVHTEVTLSEVLARTQHEDFDLIAHTGDLIHFPSQANIEGATQRLADSGVPWLYTTGNHDWRFPQIKGGDEDREEWRPKLAPLHRGEGAQSVMDVGGVRFLAIDDSNYQITEAQLAFAREQLAGGLPTVLLTHIPLSIATLRDPTIEVWKDPILIGDPDWPVERRERWLARADHPATGAFLRLVAGADNMAAVLCGHIHFHHADTLSPQCVQYVGAPGFEGGYRVVEFVPLNG